MTPKKFDYYSPSSINEAMQILQDNEEAKVLAGGQSLLALMKLRLAAPTALVDISKLKDLSYIHEDRDYLGIGALTTHDTVEHSQVIKKRFTLLNDAASKIGDQQIRNMGTIGGSACHADPAADMPTALTAADARFVIRSPGGERVVPATEFFTGLFETAVGHDEVLSEIRLHYLPPHSASAYIKHSRREGDFAIVGTGVVLTVGDGNVCKDIRIAFGAVGPKPLRARSAENYLKGKTLDDKTIAEAAEMANEGADPPSDLHGSRNYRMEMIKVFARRTIKLAKSRLE
jgi:aerobic carbon-monoxide dehydrogenase medium subunit